MAREDWRIRLKAALDADGRSMNAVSVAAECAPNYLQGILTRGQTPTLDRFFRVCHELKVSPSFVLTGFSVSPETESIVAALEDHPDKRAAILALLDRRRPSA